MTSENDKLLQQQRDAMEKITNLLEKSSSSLLCGPDCQQQKRTEKLYQEYLSAKTNKQTAPFELEEARKNYIIASKGDTYYLEEMEKKLYERAETISQAMTEHFDKEIKTVNTLNTYYNSELINAENIGELYNHYKASNQKLKKNIKSSNSDILTNDRKTYYETQGIDSLKWWGNLFWLIYYILILVVVVMLVTSTAAFSIIKIIIILVVACLYPFIISPLINWVYNLFAYLFSFLPKNVYNTL